MLALLSLGWLIACSPSKDARSQPADTGCAGCGDTAAPADTAPPAEETGETAPPDSDDTAPPEDTGDTGSIPEEPCLAATFTDRDGGVTDMTDVFTAGDYVTLAEAGTLTFCPGDWHVHLVIEADVDIRGLGEEPADTVLSGGASGTVVSVVGPAVVTVEDVTISRGRALGAGNNSAGGGIRCEGGSLAVAGSRLVENEAYDGGGLYADGCELALSDVSFVGNSATDDGGGMAAWHSDVAVTGALFEANSANDGGGFVVYYSTLAVQGSSFQANEAHSYGGAVWTYDSDATLTDSAFAGGAGFQGGALWLYGTAVLSGLTFQGNAATAGGGAVFHYKVEGGWTEGADCDFAGNAPDDVRSAASSSSLILGKGASFRCDPTSCYEE